MKTVIKLIVKKSLGLSIFVIILNLLSFVSFTKALCISWSNDKILLLSGFVALILTLLYSTVHEIYYSLMHLKTEFVTMGKSIKGTKYDYIHLFDDKCKEMWLVGQNLKTVLSDEEVREHILCKIKKDTNCKANFVLTTFDIMKTFGDEAVEDFLIVLGYIKEMYEKLDESKQKQLLFHFNISTTTLSGMFRDPDIDERGLMVITPKWGIDSSPGDRPYIVIERSIHKDLFTRFSGHLSTLAGSNRKELSEICREASNSKFRESKYNVNKY